MILTYLTKRSFQLLIIFLLLAVAPFLAHAQNAVSMSVSPALFEMNANPSQVWESTVRITNNNPFELTVYADSVNFRPLGEDGSSQFTPVAENSGNSTLAEWISVPDAAFVIPAEQTFELPIKINLPDDAPPGGHYAAVLVGTRPPEDRDSTMQVETSQVVSALIFLRVSGDVIEEGNIRTFRAVDSLIESPEVDFELRFQNTGNVHLRPEGEIRIYNMWGQERGIIPINRQTLFGNILSDSIRSFNFTWEGEWSPADIGRYTAKVTMAYGQDARNFTSAEASFWLIPWRVLLGIVLVLGLIVLALTWLVKLYVRRMLSIAGLENQNPLQRTLATERRREVSVVAPIEEGILDLRSRFSDERSNKLNAFLDFVSEYRMFFIGVVIIWVILYIFSWFFSSVSEDDRAFEVTISGAGESVTVDSESLQFNQRETYEIVAKRDIPPIDLVNRSGVNGAAANIGFALEELGYTIDSVSTELNIADGQTVIVYNPELEDEALELSAVLDNALLSAFVPENNQEFTIIVYVGSDISN